MLAKGEVARLRSLSGIHEPDPLPSKLVRSYAAVKGCLAQLTPRELTPGEIALVVVMALGTDEAEVEYEVAPEPQAEPSDEPEPSEEF